jgi:hypothetical protein
MDEDWTPGGTVGFAEELVLAACARPVGAEACVEIDVKSQIGFRRFLRALGFSGSAYSSERSGHGHADEPWVRHFNEGLAAKEARRFRDGQRAGEAALTVGGASEPSVLWNLGICATGAGDGAAALEAWRRLGFDLTLGRRGLPEGSFPPVEVCVVGDGEGGDRYDSEVVWIERLSPCHGILRGAVFQQLGVDYGDLVLFDGAPVEAGERAGPVLPVLATLEPGGYLGYRFAGVQENDGEIVSLSSELAVDGAFCLHTKEHFRLCHACWARADGHSGPHVPMTLEVVTGKLCLAPELDPAQALRRLEEVLAARGTVELWVPELARAAGDVQRASRDGARFAMLDM